MMELIKNVILICVLFYGQYVAAAGSQDSEASLDLADQSPAIQKRQETPEPEECVDKAFYAGQCRGWAQTGECAKNQEWMETNCCVSCAKRPKLQAECVDREVAAGNCTAWKESGECETNPTWMNINCCESCGCRNVPGFDEQCTVWAMNNYCGTDYPFNGRVQEQCRSTCAVCDKNSIIPQDLDSGTCRDWLSSDLKSDPCGIDNVDKCYTRPVYMFTACKKTCGGCGWLEEKDYRECAFRECEAWFAEGLCDSDPAFMNLYCKRVCDGKLCKDRKPGWRAFEACLDEDSDAGQCRDRAQTGECAYNPAWMGKNCCVTCAKLRKVQADNPDMA